MAVELIFWVETNPAVKMEVTSAKSRDRFGSRVAL